jgi:3-hydroxyacyl-CoA dehydrogenase/enoyl-CoA hydratase/3-hydroxybutyryl-CoA epimerase
MAAFPYQKDADGIATVIIDMPGPVNVMTNAFTDDMAETVARLAVEEGLAGVVIASGKKTFFAGGDVKGMAAAPAEGFNRYITEAIGRGRAMMRSMERLPVPVVAAINGAALGGGYELTLACNHRIAWDDPSVVIGLPEATLGLLPGGGGCVRMVKRFGIQKALPYLLSGRRLSAREALAEGLVDELAPTAEALVPQAKAWILAHRGEADIALQPWDRKGYRVPGGGLDNPAVRGFINFGAFRLFEETRGLLPHKQLIFDIAVEALKLDIDAALQIETRGLVSCIVSPVTKNMMAANFLQMNEIKRGKSRPEGFEKTAIRRLGVIGAGMMGQGIAHVAAIAGIDVVLADVTAEAAERGKAHSEALLDKAMAKGKLDAAGKDAVLARIMPTGVMADLAGCDLVIEAVFEKLELKHEVSRAVEPLLAAGGIIASNTSTLPITRLAEAVADPARFIGLHFFSPVDRMPLVEIIRGESTSDETLARAFDFVRQIRMTPIVVRDKPGFFTSRTIGAQIWEGVQMVAEGVHPLRVDNLGKSIGLPVGPLTLHDEVSQRLSEEILATQKAMGLVPEGEGPRPEASRLVRAMVAEGRGGRRYGGGYYDYGDNGKTIWPALIECYYKPNAAIPDADVKDRLLFAAVIESLKCLDEGVLRSVAEGNVGALLGIGAPTWTGGYIQFVNTYGLQRFIDRCDELSARYGDRLKAPPIVARTLAAGGSFV